MFVPILAYHKVQSDAELGVTFVTPKTFATQVEFLHNAGFKTISIHDYLAGHDIPARPVIITFDDAYTCVYENAFPILKQYNFTATIFVITKFIGNVNQWDYSFRKTSHCDREQLQALLEAGWEIGSHTVNHLNLRTLSDSQLWYELKYSKEVLENQLQKTVGVVSYPFGKFDERVISAVREAGYSGGCTLGYNFPYNQVFPYALFRRGVYFFEPSALFRAKLENSVLSHLDDVKQRFITFCSQATLLLQYLRSL